MKKLIFGLLATVLLFSSGFSSSNLNKWVTTCHIRIWWHNSSGDVRMSDIYVGISNYKPGDCTRIAISLMPHNYIAPGGIVDETTASDDR